MKWYDPLLFVGAFAAANAAGESFSDEPRCEYVTASPPTWPSRNTSLSLVGDWVSSDGSIRFSFDGTRYKMFAPSVAVRGDYRHRTGELILQVDGHPPEARWTGTVHWDAGVLVLRGNGTGPEKRFVRCNAVA